MNNRQIMYKIAFILNQRSLFIILLEIKHLWTTNTPLTQYFFPLFADGKLPLLDATGLAGIVVPTSDEDAERDLIASEITSFLVSMTLKKDDGRYQCLICARESRDLSQGICCTQISEIFRHLVVYMLRLDVGLFRFIVF